MEGKRINDLNRRIEKARNNPKYKSIDEEGKGYFEGKTSLDVQETVGEEVEKFLAKKISRTTGTTIDPKELPAFIDQELKKEIENVGSNVQAKAAKNSTEREKQFQQIVPDCLYRASSVHDKLGKAGEELVQKNQFGETALRADIDCEEAILNFLRQTEVPIRVISEEHGQVDVRKNPRFLGILDGLDGSEEYKKGRGERRYGTMFGIFNTLNPSYKDYLVSGIMEHSTGRLFLAVKNQGAFVIEGGEKRPIKTSGKTVFDEDIIIYEDNYFEINRKIFSQKTQGYRVHYIRSSAVCYADVTAGTADLALECTRKNNLEIAVAFGLVTEAGGVMIDLKGISLSEKKYLDFGQKQQLPIITAATKELAEEFLAHLKK